MHEINAMSVSIALHYIFIRAYSLHDSILLYCDQSNYLREN